MLDLVGVLENLVEVTIRAVVNLNSTEKGWVMKKLMMVAAFGAAGLLSIGTQAASVNDTFDVDINLTSACQLSTITNVTFAYTSFQVGASASAGGVFTVTCTNNLPYTMALDQTNVTDDALNLAYTLAVAAGGTGNGAAQGYTVTGNMAGGQGGNCAAATCNNGAATNNTRQLTVTY